MLSPLGHVMTHAVLRKDGNRATLYICAYVHMNTLCYAITYRIQNVRDATAGPRDPRHDPGHCAASLHHSQLAVKQQMERKHAAESGGTHFWLCTQTEFHLTECYVH